MPEPGLFSKTSLAEQEVSTLNLPAAEAQLAAYLTVLKTELRLRGDPERRALSRVEGDLREMAYCYQEEDSTLSNEAAMVRALADFGAAEDLGRKLHEVYCPRLSPKEVGLLAIFPVALLPLLEA